MSDDPKPTETPMQRALRLKKAAQAAGNGRPGAGRDDERAAAARSQSKSKPWMKKS
ncbi:MAG: hypothetical protein AB1942_21845 [Pseudomonadota bacterium]